LYYCNNGSLLIYIFLANVLDDNATGVDLDYLNVVINEIELIFPTIIKVHYLRHLICVKQREWEGALENLHRYFDYCYCDTSSHQQQQQANTNTNGMIASYASLNLAALHYRFGHYGAAITSIQETMRIAHQKNENECLALALAWLFRLADCKGMEERAELLIKRCIERADELGMHDLLSQSQLAYTKLSMLRFPYGPGALNNIGDPASIWEEVHHSMQVNLESHLSVLTKTNLLTRSSIWEYYGNRELSAMFARIVADENNISQEDYLLGHCKIALMFNEEGNYLDALTILVKIQEKIKVVSDGSLWTRTLCSILFSYFYRSNQIENARIILEKMNDLREDGSIDPMDNLEYNTDLLEKKAQLLLVTNQNQEAARIMHNALQICETSKLHIVYVKRLLFLVEILMVCVTILFRYTSN
jgi:anaphase-promoting complex subunit 5